MIERRPYSEGRPDSAAFPPEWCRGELPPSDFGARTIWIRDKIREGIERRSRGESVAWLRRV